MKGGFALGLITTLAVLGAPPTRAHVPTRTTPQSSSPSPEAVLEQALGNFYVDGYARVRLTNYQGETKGIERVLKVWTKGRCVLGVFTEPEDIRHTGLLVIPPPEELAKDTSSSGSVLDNQYFIYLPAFKRIRRISGAQRADSFFGTYLSQGDVEPHPASDFEIVSMRDGEYGEEAIHELTIRPRFDGGYDRAVVSVAKRDAAVLRIEEYRSGRKTPIRVIVGHRSWMETRSGHVVPEKLVVSAGEGDGRTVVVFSDRNLQENIPTSMFTTNYLERTGH